MSAIAAGPSPYWYLTRGAGVVSLLLLTASVVLGIVDFSRWRSERWPRFVIDSAHRDVSLLALILVAVHVLTTVVDGYTPIGLKDAVIPFVSPYRPLWLGLGTLAFDVLLAVAVTSMLRGRLGYRAWRAVHWAAYACWPLAVLHGLGTGTDTPLVWMLALTAACVLAVLIAVGWRAVSAWPEHAGRRLLAGSVLAVSPVALVVWLVAGPLGSNWARRAGTPTTLLAAATPNPGTSSTASSLQAPFTAGLAGPVRQGSSQSGLTSLDLPMSMSGGAKGTLDVKITGQAIAGGGVSMTRSAVSLGPPGDGTLYTGRVTALRGSRILAAVSSGGASIQLQIQLSIDQGNQTVNGTVSAHDGSSGGAGA